MKLTRYLLLPLLLSACSTIPAVNTTEQAAELLATDQAFAELSARSGPKQAFTSYLAGNGMMFPAASEGALVGLSAITAVFGEADDAGYQLLWQPQLAEVALAGDMGWTWGQYQVMVEQQTVSTGKYINVWQKQSDGSWKVRADLGNQRPPVTSESSD